MLHEFLTQNRGELVDRCRSKVALRSIPSPMGATLQSGVPVFLDQLIGALRSERRATGAAGEVSLVRPPPRPSDQVDITASARRHGRELLQQGVSIDQVVHNYGDLCQAVTQLAYELGAPITVDEFQTLNRCLDDAIAGAVTEFAAPRSAPAAPGDGTKALNERLGYLAHELRNYLQSAMAAVAAIKTGNVGVAGSTGALLERSLIGMRNLIDRSLTEVRVTAGLPPRHQLVSIAELIADVRISLSLEVLPRECTFTVAAVEPGLAADADREMLFSAIGNLLQNAFKFTLPGTEVSLKAYGTEDRILIEVADHCGGLPAGAAESLFVPFFQKGIDKRGQGLGLSICRRSVEANNGVVSVRDIPGTGCVFTIDLPRYALR